LRLIVFDVDGTLVDSQQEIVEAQARAFAAFGLMPPGREKALSVVGLSLTEAFTALAGASGPVEGLAEAYKAAWTDLRMRPGYADRLYPGAAATVAALAVAPGVRLGIATGKSRRGVDRILAAQGWMDMFATIQTADDHPSKPHPSMIETAMAETGAAPGETVMIGDTTYDMDMAAAAGVRAVGVAWGYHKPAALRSAGAFVVVETFDALGVALETFFSEAA
jgi:phosphoglycolate phosphatase